jgi:ribosomal-protein-alanine N-acetyltransferase
MIKFSPFPVLKTKRLILREITAADAGLIHKLRSDQTVNALIGRANSRGIEDALLFINIIKNNVARHESVYWVICLENSNDLIGTICYWNFNPSAESAEMGYELLTGFRGQGLMNEVIPAVIKFGFEEVKLKSITAFPSEQNIVSVRLLEKFGFQLTDSDPDNPSENNPGILKFVLQNPEKHLL